MFLVAFISYEVVFLCIKVFHRRSRSHRMYTSPPPKKNMRSAQMLVVALFGIETVLLRLERDTWSMCRRVRTSFAKFPCPGPSRIRRGQFVNFSRYASFAFARESCLYRYHLMVWVVLGQIRKEKCECTQRIRVVFLRQEVHDISPRPAPAQLRPHNPVLLCCLAPRRS